MVRLGPQDDATAITAAQLRAVVQRLIAAGPWTPGDPDITIVMHARYDVTRLAWVLRDLPVELVGRIRGDRVMRLPRPSLKEYALVYPQGGRPPKHGPEFRFNKPETWPEPAITTATDTTYCGKAEAQAWDRVHPRLAHRSARLQRDGELPIVEGTLVRVKVEHLSKEREAPPVWLWSSKTGADPADVDRCWQVFLREIRPGAHLQVHKTDSRLDHPETAYARGSGLLDLAPGRHAHPTPPGPAAGRRPPPPLGEADQARTPHPGPGPPRVQEHPIPPPLPRPCSPTSWRRSRTRPPGTKNRRPAPHYDVGKTVKRPETLKAIGRPGRSW
ncbi:hypothetical protein GCM10010326_64930 [Streptomyces xanthochromogenes]|uniref:Transposase IS701-like DDE domain-containing protein n=1 Tax=Streptomyces xanthochromogenes TaxID=67384 RepID=A0ABQ3AQ11_9ACTN|nr:hypothetical protein GCM10010326_64930 [Streptomyces xanthochromogenes]